MDLRSPSVQRAATFAGNFTWVVLGLCYLGLRSDLASDATRVQAIAAAGVAGAVVLNAPLVVVLVAKLARGERDGVAPRAVSLRRRGIATGLFTATILQNLSNR